MLLVFLSHQSALTAIVIFCSGIQPVILYEPVPITLRLAKFSSLAL
jgi:hypothetical protein